MLATNNGLVPFAGLPIPIDVDGTHLQTLALTVDVFDSAGNLTRTSVPLTLLLSRTTDLTGTLALENRPIGEINGLSCRGRRSWFRVGPWGRW
jgi:hypothetical protein